MIPLIFLSVGIGLGLFLAAIEMRKENKYQPPERQWRWTILLAISGLLLATLPLAYIILRITLVHTSPL